jgi:hypothetical protein
MIPNFCHLTQLQSNSNFPPFSFNHRFGSKPGIGTGDYLLKGCGYCSFSGGSSETEILYIPYFLHYHPHRRMTRTPFNTYLNPHKTRTAVRSVYGHFALFHFA